MPKQLTTRQRVERAVDKEIENGGLFNRITISSTIKLILAERRRIRREVVKMIRERGDEYMRDADDPRKKNMAAINAGRAWAFKDMADDILARLRG